MNKTIFAFLLVFVSAAFIFSILSEATEPNLGNLIVYADSGQAEDKAEPGGDSSASSKSSTTNILLLAAILVAGAIFGYLFGRKSA